MRLTCINTRAAANTAIVIINLFIDSDHPKIIKIGLGTVVGASGYGNFNMIVDGNTSFSIFFAIS